MKHMMRMKMNLFTGYSNKSKKSSQQNVALNQGIIFFSCCTMGVVVETLKAGDGKTFPKKGDEHKMHRTAEERLQSFTRKFQ